MASKKSKVWRFFTISTADEHKAICNLCTAEVSWGGSRAKTYMYTANPLVHSPLGAIRGTSTPGMLHGHSGGFR